MHPGRLVPKTKIYSAQMNDIERLANCLRRDFPNLKPSVDRAWFREPALRVIDCVLSLRRSYDHFVVPRLDEFERRNSEVKSVRELRELMNSFGKPDRFVREELNYRDGDRARILDSVVDRVLELAAASDGANELKRLESWAVQAQPEDYTVRRIRGFALAGHQYLRMLFGANTTKPDVHICRYVARCLGRRVSDLEALNLLEAAAKMAGVSLRNLDTTIWETSARRCSCCRDGRLHRL